MISIFCSFPMYVLILQYKNVCLFSSACNCILLSLARTVQCTLVYSQRSNGCSIAPCIRVVRIRPAKNSRPRDVITTRETSRVDVFVRFIDGGLFVSAQLLPVRYTVLPAPTAVRPRATIIETEVVARRILYLYI